MQYTWQLALVLVARAILRGLNYSHDWLNFPPDELKSCDFMGDGLSLACLQCGVRICVDYGVRI